MSHLIRLSQEEKTFQLRLAFGFFFLVSLLYAVLVVGTEVAQILFGATAQASVVYVSDLYNSRGYRVTTPRVDYEYFDAKAKIYRRDMYWSQWNEPRPALGQTLDVRYIPAEGWSSPITDRDGVFDFWPIIPPLVLGGLLWLSLRREDPRTQ